MRCLVDSGMVTFSSAILTSLISSFQTVPILSLLTLALAGGGVVDHGGVDRPLLGFPLLRLRGPVLPAQAVHQPLCQFKCRYMVDRCLADKYFVDEYLMDKCFLDGRTEIQIFINI